MALKSVHSFNISTPRLHDTFLPARQYALGETLVSGQAFRWTQREGAWEGVIGKRWVRLIEENGGIRAWASSDEWVWLESYLQTGVDIDSVTATFPNDPHLDAAVASCRGLRLLRQEPWECLASFILSSTKQIVQIRQIVALVCQRFGEPVSAPVEAYSFPSAARLAVLSEAELRCCKMGFRAPYLKGTAALIASGSLDLEALRQLDVREARERLMRCPGVGRKIADCVLLFAYGFHSAFPVDVWILKALRQLYFPKRQPTPKRLLQFTQTYFGPNAGYAQQYLFHYMRIRQNEPVTS